MSSASDTITEYLRDARAREEAQASTFAEQLRAAPPGGYRTFVRRHHDETRRHAQQVAERLTDLGAGTNPVEFGLSLVEDLVGRAVEVALAPLGLFATRTQPEEVLRQARDAIADEARELATYRALERLASIAGDRATASLARQIAGDEERALEQLRDMLPALVDRVARERFGTESTAEARDEAADDAGEEAQEPEAEADAERDAGGGEEAEPEDERSGAAAGGSNGGPVVARDDEEAGEERVPPDPRERDGVPGPELHVDAPWEGYDDMTAAQVLERLRDADEALVGVVRLYEQAHKRRKTILQARTDA